MNQSAPNAVKPNPIDVPNTPRVNSVAKPAEYRDRNWSKAVRIFGTLALISGVVAVASSICFIVFTEFVRVFPWSNIVPPLSLFAVIMSLMFGSALSTVGIVFARANRAGTARTSIVGAGMLLLSLICLVAYPLIKLAL